MTCNEYLTKYYPWVLNQEYCQPKQEWPVESFPPANISEDNPFLRYLVLDGKHMTLDEEIK